MKKVIRIILLLAFIGGGTYYYMKSSGKLDDNTGKILVSGNLELTQVDLSFKTAGIPYRKGGVDAAMAKLAR